MWPLSPAIEVSDTRLSGYVPAGPATEVDHDTTVHHPPSVFNVAGMWPKGDGPTGPAQPAEPGTGVSLSLGHSMLLLYGPWKFRVSDSPIDAATNQPLWAQPEFDDAAWSCLQWRLF
jgi:hypothetical protein